MQKQITDFQLWDKFVAKSPQGSVFCTSDWLKLYDDFMTMGIYKKYTLIGAIPLIKNSSGYGIPLTPYQGVLCIEDSLQLKLAEEISNECHTNFSFHWSFQDIRPFIWNGYSQKVKFTYVVKRPFFIETLEKDTRYQVKKDGSVVSKGDSELFWDIYCATFKRKGIPLPIEKTFYDRMIKTIPNDVFTCSNGSGAVILYDNKRGYYILGGSDGERSSALVVYTALKEALSKVEEVDLVGANSRDISCYKSGFGGNLTAYYQTYI